MKRKMRKFAEGGFSAAQEEFLGGADRTDPYILARMRSAVPDEVKAPEYKDESMGEFTTNLKEPSTPVTKKATKSAESTVTKSAPAKSTEFKALTNKDEEGNKLPTDVKKPFIAIPKNAAGMQQYRSDAVSPIERLIKSISGKSQRTSAAEKKMKKGGSVKVSSASKRADACAQRGKTRGKMC
jgi:hypothetical protein